MRNRITLAAVLVAVALSLTVVPATAAETTATPAAPAAQTCGEIRLTGSLPAPPAGMAVQQQITIGADCEPRLGEARLVPVASEGAAKTAVSPAAAPAAGVAAVRQFKSWNEMYDCCNIRMTGLYTTSQWTTDGGRITTAATDATQAWNREPWNAGWSLKSATKNTDCFSDCGVSRTEAHADFTYKGIFDISGNVYANTHHSSVDLNADGSATCRFDVSLRNTFIGWNWQRGCA
ncbi:hypothetical protein OG429_40565 (plasmid) [Streptomyces sp. NBC_00190]|uniref:hypothetical protein n=1 Tax=unclassified Streptomyces TaxID=2593676 RepID=UPI002E27AB63|nr:hypothetical protein [Streptomyces sp. NBC_00190]WSZ45743.1 hypothetical protein OG239_44060 [Streptomyces sp. NBC_00868]